MVKCCCGNEGYGKLSCLAGVTAGKELYFLSRYDISAASSRLLSVTAKISYDVINNYSFCHPEFRFSGVSKDEFDVSRVSKDEMRKLYDTLIYPVCNGLLSVTAWNNYMNYSTISATSDRCR